MSPESPNTMSSTTPKKAKSRKKSRTVNALVYNEFETTLNRAAGEAISLLP